MFRIPKEIPETGSAQGRCLDANGAVSVDLFSLVPWFFAGIIRPDDLTSALAANGSTDHVQ